MSGCGALRVRTVALLALAAMLGGCAAAGISYYDAPYERHYTVSARSSPACVQAAQQARFWCRNEQRAALPAERFCAAAQWNYATRCG